MSQTFAPHPSSIRSTTSPDADDDIVASQRKTAPSPVNGRTEKDDVGGDVDGNDGDEHSPEKAAALAARRIHSVSSPVRLSNHDLSLGIVKHGYLWKRSSNVKRDWKRRWFLIQGGKLKYQRQEVRASEERRGAKRRSAANTPALAEPCS